MKKLRPAVRGDIAFAVIAALIILIASPGIAATGAIALLVLAVCGVTVWIERRRRRGRGGGASLRPKRSNGRPSRRSSRPGPRHISRF